MTTFPDAQGLVQAGTHDGLAATSVLEPMVLLYRTTGDARYLAFAQHIVARWQMPGGPALLRQLLAGPQGARVAGGKAYELLSNLLGAVELAQVSGDAGLLQAVRAVWHDIVAQRLYPTGTTSQWEHFQPDQDWRDDVRAHLGETCVTTTWIQLNLALLLHTGEACFADEIERATYNHLTAAQHPAGDDWCYFTPLQGRKPYQSEITCCHSSGPRGLALVPMAVYLVGHWRGVQALHISTLETSSAQVQLDGHEVGVSLRSGFPLRGQATLTLRMARPTRWALKVRRPDWAGAMSVPGATLQDGWLVVPERTWRDGDQITIGWPMLARTLRGSGVNSGRTALAWGPFVLAHEAPTGAPPSHRLGFTRGPLQPRWAAGQPLRLSTRLALLAGDELPAELTPFADAGGNGDLLRVWLRAPGRATRPPGDSLLLDGVPSQSRGADAAAALNDDDHERSATTSETTATTASAAAASAVRPPAGPEDWFAITLKRPVQARRFVFTPGVAASDGGWFDTRQGKPRVQVQRRRGGAWETLGRLDSYPDTTDADPGPLANGWDRRSFVLVLPAPVRLLAVRIIGRPAGTPAAYATCAELQAFKA